MTATHALSWPYKNCSHLSTSVYQQPSAELFVGLESVHHNHHCKLMHDHMLMIQDCSYELRKLHVSYADNLHMYTAPGLQAAPHSHDLL